MTKRKVKVVKSPAGRKHMGDQMGYGLYRGQSIRDFNAFSETDPYTDVRNVYPESPRSEANIEVEKGEKIIARDGMSLFDVPGEKHYNGGTPIKAEPGSYVVSDFIKAPKLLQAKMGFQVKSNKAKDNTWARVLESKVSTKDFNKLAEFLRQAATNVDSDKYELATAKNKMAVYQDYISKAALGNELTKMMEGKDYKIPEIGIPALQKMFPEMAEQMMGQQQEQQAPVEQQDPPEQMMAYGGQYYSLPQALEGMDVYDPEYNPFDIIEYPGGKTKAGTIMPTGLSNKFNRGSDYYTAWADILGMDVNDLKQMKNSEVQSLIYDWTLQNNPEEISRMWKETGLTNQGKKYKDLIGMTQKDSKGNPLYTFDKNKSFSPQQLASLKKGYVDGMFGRRQLEPKVTPDTPVIRFTPDIVDEGPPEEILEPTPNPPGMKYICNPTAGGVIPIPAGMANQTPGSPITYYNTLEEAEAACSKKETTITNTTRPYDSTFEYGQQGDIPRLPYEQDVISLGTALANKYNSRDVFPFRKRANAIGWDPAFYSTAAQEALLASQAQGAMEDASLYAGSPQVQAARQQQTQQASIPALMQARMTAQQANIGQDTQARISNAAIFNQAGMQDAAMANQLTDMTAKFISNKDAGRKESNVDVANQINDLLTNSGDTALMNTWFPQKAFNPLNYKTYFRNGKNIRDDAARTNDNSDDFDMAYQAMSRYLKDPKDITAAALDYMKVNNQGYSSRSRKQTRGVSPQDDDGYGKDGGYIPMYRVGGLW